MTWDHPPTTAGRFRVCQPPEAESLLTNGPERVSFDPPEVAPIRRYVGFADPSGADPRVDAPNTIPGVW